MKSVVLLLFLVSVLAFQYQLQDENLGFYAFGRITLWPDRMVNWNQYFLVSQHEYAHHIYHLMNRTEIAVWEDLVDTYGFESGYPDVEKNWHRYNEEFAECFENTFQSEVYQKQCSEEKINYTYTMFYAYSGLEINT